MSLKGKTAVVTGSTSGIGHAIALALAKDGANIVVNGLGTEKDNEKAIREVAALGTRVAFDPANMLRHNQIAEMIAKAEKDFGVGRRPGQQRRHPACGPGRGVSHRAVGRHHRHQPRPRRSTPCARPCPA